MNTEHTTPTLENTDDNWDSRALGTDPHYAQPVAVDEVALDEALELQLISIRLHKSLIEDFKLIAGMRGLGYQPLMRQVLKRFADCEKKQILQELAQNQSEAQRQTARKTA